MLKIISLYLTASYEEVGLIESIKKDGYAYRTYDEKNIKKLRQILILRKLRIKLKDISSIVNNQNIDEMLFPIRMKESV
jgi:DNA-binding transcriptional MerR regulator